MSVGRTMFGVSGRVFIVGGMRPARGMHLHAMTAISRGQVGDAPSDPFGFSCLVLRFHRCGLRWLSHWCRSGRSPPPSPLGTPGSLRRSRAECCHLRPPPPLVRAVRVIHFPRNPRHPRLGGLGVLGVPTNYRGNRPRGSRGFPPNRANWSRGGGGAPFRLI